MASDNRNALCYFFAMPLQSRLAGLIVACLAIPVLGQLPPDLKSDLGPDVPAFRVRPGYRVTRAYPARELRESRFILFSDDGKTLFLTQNRQGTILALRDPDADGAFTKTTKFVTGKPSAQGMCMHDGWLYFSQAAEGAVFRARDTQGDGVADKVETVIPPKTLPSGGGHPYEGLLVTDKEIYITCSDATNMADELNSDRKTIYVFNIDGSNKRVFCTGIRNTEKLRFRPGTSEIYGFDHGSDNFGGRYGERSGKDQPITDLNPPEELNHYTEGGFYGHPFLSGNRVPRPEYANRPDIIELADKTIPPVWCVHAHWAVLGFTFITKDYFPGQQGDLYFASHGSWNSVKPVGACIERVEWDNLTGRPVGSMTIVDCAGPERRLSRPVDLAEAPDGTLLFSSDEPPGLFRISRSGETK